MITERQRKRYEKFGSEFVDELENRLVRINNDSYRFLSDKQVEEKIATASKICLFRSLLMMADHESVGAWVLTNKCDLVGMHKALRSYDPFNNGKLESAIYAAWSLLMDGKFVAEFKEAIKAAKAKK